MQGRKYEINYCILIGCFPADKPRYTVSMVVLRKHKLPVSSAMLSGAVNALIDWLNERTL